MNQIELDAALYAEITELLNEQRALLGSERRGDDRRSYECLQLVAPYSGGPIPGQDDFRQERCNDLSSSGFAFISPRRPATSKVVVALGQVPFLFYIAEIAHVHEVETEHGQDFFVGCSFVSRVEQERKSPV